MKVRSIQEQHCAIEFLQRQNKYETIQTTLFLPFSPCWYVLITAWQLEEDTLNSSCEARPRVYAAHVRVAFNIESRNCCHTQHKLSKNYNLNIRVVIVYNMYCVTLSQNLNIRVLIVYLHFSHASDNECMLPTNVLHSKFHRESLQPT